MLHGRESLIRLIGKRKQNFSSSLSQSLLKYSNYQDKDDINTSCIDKEEERNNLEFEWITCPVCAASIKGADHIINSHLDTCLTRGTKRKLTQRTLLQLNFSPQSKNLTSSDASDNSRASAKKCGLVVGKDSVHNSQITIEKRSIKNDECVSSSSKCVAVTKEVASSDDYSVIETVDSNFVEEVETFIVGRKFHGNVKLQQGDKVSLFRDSQNAKDTNAIKVLSADSETGLFLGYIPRELAKFLSPLIDNCHLKCEGHVISVPQCSSDVVPIKLICHCLAGCKNDDHETCKLLWENVRSVTEYAKTNPPSMTKYQQNFHLMIDDVVNNNTHLLSSNEKLLLGSFNSLSNEAQRLFIRIYTRKGPWFRLSNISYSEVTNVDQAINELEAASYVLSYSLGEDICKFDLKEILELLNVSEIKDILSTELSKKKTNCTRKEDLINYLFAAYEGGSCQVLPQKLLECVGRCIKISADVDALLWRVQRLFFLNGEQDLSAFLLSDLGLIKFPDYNCTITHQIFSRRSNLLEYEEAIEVAQIMDEYLDKNNTDLALRCIYTSNEKMQTLSKETKHSFESDSPPLFFSRFSASYVYSKVLSVGVSLLEREHRYVDATSILKELLCKFIDDSRRGYWTLRLSVDLEHVGRINESLSVAEKGVEDSWVRSGFRIALQKRVLRLGKPPRRWKTPSYANLVKRTIKEVRVMGRTLKSETGSKNIFYGYDGELCGVEHLALQYYADEGGGWKGVHSESGIWTTLFGILLWDVIFSDVPDVFRSRFQIAPLDLNTDDFYLTRKHMIETQLRKIEDGMKEEMLIISYESHTGTACQGVNWDKHSLSDLRAIVGCINGTSLAALLRHLAMDYRSWSRGMPDLLLWRFNEATNCAGEVKLVEVKSLNDRLSEQQRAWLFILMDCGFDVEVCKVSPK